MGDALEVALDRRRQIALHDLHVIDVVLHPQIVRPHLLDDVDRLLRAIEIEARDVARVDGFDQQPDPCGFELVGCKTQVGNEGLA